MSQRNDSEQRADKTFARLWYSIAAPSSDELRELARNASAEPRRSARHEPRQRLRARAVAAAAVALLVGSGLGFSLADTVTPSGSAGRNVVGFGFLPDRGWSVVQQGGPSPGATTATASKSDVVLTVRSTPRGDPAEDVVYDIRELPLQVSDARPLATDPTQLELRAGVGGYNVYARIQFGSATPTAASLAAAQRQLDRLVVAADRVTIAVRPAVASAGQFVTAFGTVSSGRGGESVTVQAKECGGTFFRAVAGATTTDGGSWSTLISSVTASAKLRAVWNDAASSEVSFGYRVFMTLRQKTAKRFRVYVGARASFAGKRVDIQRFDRRLGRWSSVKKVVLTSDRFGTDFILRVARSTQIRAVFPNSQARPCFLGGVSPVIRT